MNQMSRKYASRRERRREKTRQRLIEAALALMQKKPFDQVTVEEITELADVAKGTFFTYFPTKEHLLHAYIRDMTDEVYEFLDALQPENAPSQWEVLRQVMLFIAQRDSHSVQITRSIMNTAMQSEALRQMLAEILQEATAHARRGFECGQQRGEFRTDVPPEELAHCAIQLYRLCQMEWLMERPEEPLEQIVERVLEFYKPAFLANRSTGVPPVQAAPPALERDAQATFLDPTRAIAKRLGAYLPHWRQEGVTYFVTFRLADSLPQSALKAIQAEREQLRREYESKGALTPAQEARLKKLYSERIEQYLDAGYGACWLQHDEIAQIIADTLQHFDGVRYRLWAWCIMPNHVHVVVQPLGEWELSNIIHSWKSFTAKRANAILSRTGSFWQIEYYDHIVRDERDFEHVVTYTLLNPEQAGLTEWKWRGDITTSRGTGVPPVQQLTPLEQDAQATPRGTGVSPVQNSLERDAQATEGNPCD
ncbi:MAG: TetR family transcriptional regulator [Fimbriimonadales bacterium]|nr:TetR family transcriptional regulator [Fimbriimonadales bacterium]